MRFRSRNRELRRGKGYDHRALARMVGVHFPHLSQKENERLDFGSYPSNQLIGKLAAGLEADADELRLLAKKVPEKIRRRILERPDVFRKLADLDQADLRREVVPPGRDQPLLLVAEGELLAHVAQPPVGCVTLSEVDPPALQRQPRFRLLVGEVSARAAPRRPLPARTA